MPAETDSLDRASAATAPATAAGARRRVPHAVRLLVVLALAPLAISVSLYGPALGIGHWQEMPAALGIIAPRYPWDSPADDLVDVRANRTGVESVALGPAGQGNADLLHGRSLVLGGRSWTRLSGDPMLLLVDASLRAKARQILRTGQPELMQDALLTAAGRAGPGDLLVRTDTLLQRRFRPWQNPGPSSPVNGDSTPQLEVGIVPYREIAQAPAGSLWAALWRATAVLDRHAKEAGLPRRPRIAYGFILLDPSAHIAMDSDEAKEEYRRAIESVIALEPQGKLETVLEERAATAWRDWGTDARVAAYLARDAAGPAELVARCCALHQATLRSLVEEAEVSDPASAAHWIELADSLWTVLSASVRSPLAYNQVLIGFTDLQPLATLVAQLPGRPADEVARVRAIATRLPVPPLPAPPFPPLLLPALCLDNVARSGLGVAVASLVAVMVTASSLRRRRHLDIGPAGDAWWHAAVSIAALALLAAVVGAVEAASWIGELGNLVCTVGGIAFLVGCTAGITWLAVRLGMPSAGNDPLRRRIIWLVALAVMLVCLSWLLGGRSRLGHSEAYTELMLWASDPARARLPWIVAWSIGLVLPALGILYALRRWRRRAAGANDRSVVHPAVQIVAAVALGGYLIHGPLQLEPIRGRSDLAQEGMAHSPAFFAGQAVEMWLNEYATTRGAWMTWRNASSLPGWNVLIGTLVARTWHVGGWLVVALAIVWSGVVRFARRGYSGGGDAGDGAGAGPAECWLAGMTWSCLWLGLGGLVVHGWCTLALGYCVARIIA